MYRQLEDNQAGLQTMLASRFVAGIREQVHCACLLCPSLILDSVIETETEGQGDRGRDGDGYSKVMLIGDNQQVETWDKRLALVSETLDEWLTVQVGVKLKMII